MENLRRIGQLEAHAAEPVEIDRLLESAAGRLDDSRVPGVSDDSRFGMAYDSILKSSVAAMLACGYRAPTSIPGHHQTLLQSLPMTAGLPADVVLVLDAWRKLRNLSDYKGVPVSGTVADECAEMARRILEAVRRHIEARRHAG